MESDYEVFEVAAVIRDFWLVDSDSYQRKYWTRQGKPLVPGYYIVNWPDHVRVRRFDEHAEFYGPFKSRYEAQVTCDWMQKWWEAANASRISSVVGANSHQLKWKTVPYVQQRSSSYGCNA